MASCYRSGWEEDKAGNIYKVSEVNIQGWLKKEKNEEKKKLEKIVHSPSFWRTAQQVGISNKRQKANLNCVVDNNGGVRSGMEAGSFENLFNGGESTIKGGLNPKLKVYFLV